MGWPVALFDIRHRLALAPGLQHEVRAIIEQVCLPELILRGRADKPGAGRRFASWPACEGPRLSR